MTPNVITSTPDPSPTPPCVRVGNSIRPPRRIRDRKIEMPRPPSPLRSFPDVFIYEATIDVAGRVSELRRIRPKTLKDRWVPYDVRFREAIGGWEYEPLLVKGKPMPVCMEISVRIEVR